MRDGAKSAGETVSFDTGSLSVYAIVAYPVTTNLDGNSFFIVHLNTTARSTTQGQEYFGRALDKANSTTSTSNLNALRANYRPYSGGSTQCLASWEPLTEWTFHLVEGTENQYYIQADNGKYLHLGTANTSVSDTPQALTVTTSGSYVRIYYTSGSTTYYLYSSASRAQANGSWAANPYFYVKTDNSVNYTLPTLIKADLLTNVPTVSADKISVSNMLDGDNGQYVIYRSVYNQETNSYEDYAIDGNGNLVEVCDKGDAILFRPETEGDQSLLWQFTICVNSSGQSNGYYVLQNLKTGLVLDPAAGQVVGPYESLSSSGVRLEGREQGNYSSIIEKWNASDNHTWGLQVVENETTHEMTLQPGMDANSQEFSFAWIYHEPAELHTVDTVNSADQGITINVFDYKGWKLDGTNSHESGATASTCIDNLIGKNINYTTGSAGLTRNIPASVLDENGLPVFTTNPAGGAALFSPSSPMYV